MTKHYLLLLLLITSTAYSSENTNSFLNACSGVTITSANSQLVAYTNCMGRIRGYSDGHMLTVALHNEIFKTDKVKPMWCVPSSQTDGEVIQSVLGWIDANPAVYTSNNTQYTGLSGAYANITRALVDQYGCKSPTTSKNK
jgi:hypothetical protein